MNDTLKAAGRIGAELGSAKAENEKLRGLLHGAHDTIRDLAEDLDEEEFQATIDQLAEIELALAPKHTEPADTYTAVEMATAAAQGFRDGQAAVEPAPAQDEQNPIWGYAGTTGNLIAQLRTLDPDMEIYSPHRLDDGRIVLDGLTLSKEWKEGRWLRKGDDAKRVAVLWTQPDARPAQTEQQPIRLPERKDVPKLEDEEGGRRTDSYTQRVMVAKAWNAALDEVARLNAAPIAQPAPQPEQSEPNRRTLQWVVDRWHAEVANRPLVNVHRRTLDSTWRQMIRHLGEDDVVLLGPRHDDMLDASGNPLPQYAAPIAQTATQGKFRMGDLVKKSTGSEWEGRVVGTYSTEQTPEGYAVESSAHRNSVQIYPAKALEAVE